MICFLCIKACSAMNECHKKQIITTNRPKKLHQKEVRRIFSMFWKHVHDIVFNYRRIVLVPTKRIIPGIPGGPAARGEGHGCIRKLDNATRLNLPQQCTEAYCPSPPPPHPNPRKHWSAQPSAEASCPSPPPPHPECKKTHQLTTQVVVHIAP